ncbi:hypothetical protein NDU88_006502 [Pleurodeles waltl]|uniref:Uncharacterized protein n=1 Tax=Pleurodeles waltl TaxID=8319 RepID=A0AAV7NU92_PLEWA|nr:hypothetical protein NDU88_006502 [Pleurodeles waltl]
MARKKQDGNTSVALGPLLEGKEGDAHCSTGGSQEATLDTIASQSRRLCEILTEVMDIKTTLRPMVDTLQIDMSILREDHKKLKDRVTNTESTLLILE